MYPFIHRFKTQNNYYIYDINTNKTLQVSCIVFDICIAYENQSIESLSKDFQEYTYSELEEAVKEIEEAKKDNLLSSHRPKKMAFFGGQDFIESFAKYPHEQLILGVTEKCNLRCKYCIYSGNYEGQRTHGEDGMSFECAKKAIDKFLQNSKKECYISFYGGEPLIAFPLIQEIVQYVKSIISPDITVNWSMTTNGTLLKPETFQFLYENKFILTVSLDGPDYIHNRYRVYENGLATHSKIMKNLQHIYDLDKEYYHKNILFSTVSAPPFDFQNVSNYFHTNELLKSNNIMFTYMNDSIISPIYTMTDEDYSKHISQKNEFDSNYISELSSGKRENMLANNLYEKDAIRFYHRPKTELGDTIRPNGCCVPGVRRIFVSTKGELYICEKIDNAKPIGTVDTWIEPDLVKKIVDEYIEISKSCFDCWANRLCSRCFATFIEDKEFSPQVRQAECNSTKSHLNKMLTRYYTIYENNPAALDYLSDINLN